MLYTSFERQIRVAHYSRVHFNSLKASMHFANAMETGGAEMFIKGVSTSVVAGVAVAGLLAGITAAPATASSDSWVAIAASSGVEYWGYGVDSRSRDEAKRIAMYHCSKLGATNCKVVASMRNGCVAVAVRDDGRGHGGSGQSLSQAENDAIWENGGGWIVGSACAEQRPSVPFD